VLAGSEKAAQQGATHIVTTDPDVTPDPSDIEALVNAMQDNPRAVVVGRRDPSASPSSRLAARADRFWLRLQTGSSLPDIASGFRVYPVRVLQAIRPWTRGATFHNEVLVRAAWAGAPLRTADLPAARRRPRPARSFQDRLVLLLLNIHLALRSIVPWPHHRIVWDSHAEDTRITALHRCGLSAA